MISSFWYLLIGTLILIDVKDIPLDGIDLVIRDQVGFVRLDKKPPPQLLL